MPSSVKLISFYLPQFHPIPENDEWWGKGFTEWTNVTKAQPLFPNHYQPHLPTDLGFYDLRLRSVRHEQIALAKAHGIDAFCYHYYWFSGKRLLEAPLDDMLADAASDMPFCLCWANETWTRRWDGMDEQVLMEQKYLPEDDLKFIRDIEPFLRDPRYLRINGVPLLIVYQPQSMPNPKRSAEVWREYCKANGLGGLHVCGALVFGNDDYVHLGFDSGVEFPPHNIQVDLANPDIDFFDPFTGIVCQYADVARQAVARDYSRQKVFRTLFPSWDNTARRGSKAVVVLNATPANYEHWLGEACRRTESERAPEERLVFINAWNEWAEGCHLEPDRRYGRGFLEATLRVKNSSSRTAGYPDTALPAIDKPKQPFLHELRDLIALRVLPWLGYGRRWLNKHPTIKAIAKFIVPRRLR
jgi:lipopolysaccharide biosynthesis protein